MKNIVADFTISNENTINAEYSIEQDNFDCSFEIFASGVVWGAITGNITDQTDLINILNEKATISYVDTNIQSEATSRAESDTLLQNNINTLSNNLTSEINARALADNNLQAQINDINTAGYITKDVNDLSYYMLTTDINTALSGKQNTISDLADIRNNAENGNTAYNTIQNYGDIVIYNADNFATASQGALADTSIQPNDNITLLNNNAGYITGIDNSDVVNALGYTPYDSSNPAGYITSASLPTVNNSTITIQKNGSTVESFNLNQANNETINITVPTDTNDLTNNAGFITSADLPTLADLTTPAQMNAINSGATSTNIGQIATNTQAISTETLNRQNADNDLQSQIDAIVSSSDVFDIVGTYAELQAYDISTVPVNDIIKVLIDSTHNNSATYYRCVEADNVKSWSYIGSEGAYYTKSEADGRFVTNTSLTTILTDYVLSSDLSTTLANYVTSANLTTILDDYATTQWVNNQGYITGITSSDVTTALGFTPYNSTNPNGYITSADLPTNYVTTDTAQDVSGRKTFLGEKAIYFKQIATSNKLGFTLYNPSNTELGALEYRPSTIGSASLLAINCPQATGGYVGFRYWGSPAVNIVAPKVATAGNYYIPTHITNGSTTVTASNTGTVNISTLLPTIPTVGNGTITINQGGTQKGTFTVNQSGNTTINLDAGGGTVDQTFDGTSQNAQSGVAIQGKLSTNYQSKLVSGTNIKTINNTSLLGSGNIEVLQNTATATDSLTILGTTNNQNNSILIGYGTTTSSTNSTVIGNTAVSGGSYATALGCYARANGQYTTAIGNNSYANYQDVTAVGHNSQATAAGTLAVGSQSKATASRATSIGYGSKATQQQATALGFEAMATAYSATAIGYNANGSGYYATAIGYNAQVTSNNSAIQIGYGTNNTDNTLNIGFYNGTNTHYNWRLLDGTTGLIPDARISTNLARTSEIPDVSNFVTNSSLATTLTNYVTTDTAQSISGQKTFTSTIKSSVGNSLALTLSTGDAFGVTVKRTDTNNEIKFGIGQSGDNRGIWDVRHNKWAFSVTNDGKSYALGNEIAIKSDLNSLSPLRYSRYSIAQVNSTNKFIKLASMTFTQSGNRDFSYLFWVEILEASTVKSYALVRLNARWSDTSYTGHKFEILEKYGGSTDSLKALKNLTYAYSLDTKTHKMTVEIWLEIRNTDWVSYYLRPTECNEYGDYSNTPVTLSNNIWTYYNKSGNASSIASTAITSGLTQVKVTDATGVRNENNLSQVIKMWTGTKAQYDAIATKDANTLYNVEGVGLYKGTTLISGAMPNSANQSLSNLDSAGQAVIDGQWVSDTSNIVSSNITVTTSYSNNWSLASYLPNDNYTYEVLFSIYGTTETKSGATLDLRMGTDLILDNNNDAGVMALRGQTRTNNSMGYANCLILPVGTGRKVYIKSYGTGVLSVLRVQAYRRLGTNS